MKGRDVVAEYRNARLVGLLGALVAMGPLTMDMYLPAFPALARDLGVTAATIQATLTATLVGLAAGQLVVGPLSDAVGRRRPILAGLAGHALTSAICALAPSAPVLLAARLAQGACGAALSVVSMAVVRDLFEGSAAARTLSRLMLVVGIAPVVAPSLGSAVLAVGSWRAVFVTLGAVALVLGVAALVALPETLPPARRRSARPAATARTYARLLADGPFVALCLVNGLVAAILFTYIAGSSFLLQDTFGLSRNGFGIAFGVNALGMIVATQVNPVLLDRGVTPAHVLLAATVLGAVASAVLLALTSFGVGGLLGAAVPLWFAVGSCGLCFPNAPALALTRHGEAAGTAASLLGAAQFGIGGLAAPIVGALGGNSGAAMGVVMLAAALGALTLILTAVVRRPAPPSHGAAA